jgi:hypothetical protein
VSYHLAPLSYFETRGYIKHRLTVAQADPDLFSEAAIKTVFHFTKGVPRLINSICDMACVYGYADGLSQLDTDIVLAVIQDKKQSGLLPLYNLGGRLDRQDLESAIEASVTASCADEGTYDLAPPPGSEEDRQSVGSADRVARGDSRQVATGNPLHSLGAYSANPPSALHASAATSVIVPITSQRRRQTERSGNLKWLFRL